MNFEKQIELDGKTYTVKGNAFGDGYENLGEWLTVEDVEAWLEDVQIFDDDILDALTDLVALEIENEAQEQEEPDRD